jgi:hypothetical protein
MLTVWLGRRGGGGSAEDAQHLTVIRLFLLEHGSSRFVKLEQAKGSKEWAEANPERPVVRRAGWRKADSTGRDHYLVPPDVWKEIYAEAGIDPMEAAKTLHRSKLLVTDGSPALTVKVRIPGMGRPRVYRVHPDLLGESSE